MKIALIGKSAAGKDTVKNLLIQKGLKPEVSYTTRQPRKGEIDGTSYHFMTDETFHQVEMLEKVCFNGWWYGTGVQEFAKSELFIFTPTGLSLLPKKNREEIIAVYLDVSPDIQLRRLQDRGDDLTELHRRIDADIKDFEFYKDFNIRFNTDNLSAEIIANRLFHVYSQLNAHDFQLSENHQMIIDSNDWSGLTSILTN